MTQLIYRILTLCCIALIAVPLIAQNNPSIPLKHTKNIKVVYQVSDLAEHEGVHKALFYARKLIKAYEKLGVPAEQVDLHLVYHSNAIAALLKDPAYQRLSAKSGTNPNVAIAAELVKTGVHLEMCGDTMRQKAVEKSDLLPGVAVVPGAYPRLIDLQLSGYAYIKFE